MVQSGTLHLSPVLDLAPQSLPVFRILHPPLFKASTKNFTRLFKLGLGRLLYISIYYWDAVFIAVGLLGPSKLIMSKLNNWVKTKHFHINIFKGTEASLH